MTKRSLRVGIDVDDVICRYVEGLTVFAEMMMERTLPTPQTWAFYGEWGLSKDALSDLMCEFARGRGLRYLEPIHGAGDRLRELRRSGHTIKIITARSHLVDTASKSSDATLRQRIVEDTAHWLGRQGIEYDELIFSPYKADKGIDVLIDDSPRHLEEAWAEGVTCIVMERDYNRSWRAGQGPETDIYRASSWKGINEIILGLGVGE